MKKSVRKDLFREIRKNFGRFFSIFCIVMLGSAFFAGLRSTGFDMKYSADRFYDDQKLMDIRVVSTLGLSGDDIDDLNRLEGIQKAVGGKTREAQFSTEDATYDIRTVAYVPGINEPVVTEGRLPENPDECLADAGTFPREGIRIGDMIRLETGDEEELSETLKTDRFVVTGFGYIPYYTDLTRGTGSIGDGSIDAFVLLHEDAFDTDYYTEAYVSVEGADSRITFNDEYEALIDPAVDRIDELARTATVRRYDAICQEAQEKITDAKKEVEDGEKELADAAAEIEDGKKEIADAEEEIAEKEQELIDGKEELEKGKKELADAEEEIENGRAELADAQAEVDRNAADLENAKQQYEAGLEEFNAGLAQYEAGVQSYESGLAEYEKNQADFEAGKEQYEAGLAEYNENKAAFDKGVEEYEAGLAVYNSQKEAFDLGKAEYEAGLAAWEEACARLEAAAAAGLIPEEEAAVQRAYLEEQGAVLKETGAALETAEIQLEAGKAVLDETAAQIEEANAQLEAGKAVLDGTKETLDGAEGQLAAARETLDAAKEELDLGQAKIESSRAQLEDAAAQIASGEAQLAEAQVQIDENTVRLDEAQETVDSKKEEVADAEKELADGEKKLEDGKKELEDARQELADGEAEYNEKYPEAQQEILDAKQKIADAEADIADLEVPEWYALDRGLMESIVGYDQNATRMDSLGKVFPVIFFLVAALVSLTAMTRMVDEQRMQIGTLKAQGYSNGVIAGRYLLYAMLATVSGSILGIAFGEWFLPKLIIDSYGVLYTGMRYCLTPVNWKQAVLGLAAAVAAIGIAVLAACLRQLRSKPAELMRPEAPQNGQRIFLERITGLWKRLGFTKKASLRNLVRYKKRLVMTIIGVGGCMGLLLVGFGLHDSINEVAKEQYIHIFMQDATVTVKSDAEEEEWQELEEALAVYPGVNGSERISLLSVDLQNKGAVRETSLYVPKDIEHIGEYLALRDRVTKEEYAYPQTGAVISEKTAKMLDLSVGDEVTIAREGKKNVKVPINAITENYVLHYLFLSPETYRELYREEPEYNRLYVLYDEMTEEEESDLGSFLMKYGQCTGVGFTTELEKNIDDMLAILNNVVYVLIIAAGLLAFVVLYNLNSINITERRRELATLKVLGFYDGEVAWYVYRENVILTILGCVFGLVLGTILHRFTIVTVEVDLMMFGRTVSVLSYIQSTVITIAFAVIVNFVMFFSLRKIDMVESLKSVE